MGHSNYKVLWSFALLLALIAEAVHGRYSYHPELDGWVEHYKTVATWDDALKRCQSEGAVLMSPLRIEVLRHMQAIIEGDITYRLFHFIGTHAKLHSGMFVSVEGVPVEDMPLSEFYAQLDSQDGKCLAMNRQAVAVVQCTSRRPYLCYRKDTSGSLLTYPNFGRCGTIDSEYKFSNYTQHCYKFHPVLKSWSEAYATCAGEGAYLAVLDDYTEAQLVVNITTSKRFYVYVGLRDWTGNGDWRSIHG